MRPRSCACSRASATGQEFSTYTTVSTGPRRPGDADGPHAYHVVLLDNGRSRMLGSEFRDVLRCIKCGACMNHCPVYGTVGGHAYGWVYPGPVGAVLTPNLIGLEEARHLPNASSFCGRCEEVCPMRIPLPALMRTLREQEFRSRIGPASVRAGIGAWAWLVRRPALYRLATGVGIRVLGMLGRRRGRFTQLPLAGGWTAARDLPAPEGATFHALWRKGEAGMSASGGRDAILGSIRRSLGRGPLDEAARAALDEKLAAPAPNIVPARSDISQDERIALSPPWPRRCSRPWSVSPARTPCPAPSPTTSRARTCRPRW